MFVVAAEGEVAFYLRETREQFRVKGRLQVVGASETDQKLIKARNHQWKQISPASQASFATNLIPGLEISDEQRDAAPAAAAPGKRHGGHTETLAEFPEPVDDFCLVLLWPHRVDHLVLKGAQHRHTHTLVKQCEDGSEAAAPVWRTNAVNP